jgi:diguanylate cyclase (GGDEF)-like protein
MTLVTAPADSPRSSTAPHQNGSFRGLPTPLKVYSGTLVVLGTVVLAHAVWRPPQHDLALYLGLLVTSTVASAVKVVLPLTQGGSTLSLSYVVNFIALLVLGPSGTVPIAIASAWSQCTFKMRAPNPWHQTVFSMAALGVTVAAAGWVYQLTLGQLPASALAQIASAMLAATVYFLLNSLLVAAAIALRNRQSLVAIWTQNFLWSSFAYYTGALLAMLAVAVTRYGGAVWAMLLLVPAYITYRSYRAYAARILEEQRQVREMSDLQMAVIKSLALAIEAKDRTSHDHLQRMQTYAEGLARALGMSEPEVLGVRTAALLHDIGNLAVPEHILSKTGALTNAEFERLKIHPRVGSEILKSVPFPYPVASLVLSHHERWDGRGYPAGLKGDDIPLGARIIAVVDCFGAMLAERPYRQARTYAEAIATLRENGGAALDSLIVEKFVEVLPRLEYQLRSEGTSSAVSSSVDITPSQRAVTALDHIAVAHREEHVLHEVAQTLSSTLRISDVVALISSRLVNLIPFSASALFLYDEESELYLCQYASGAHPDAIRAVTASTVEGLEKALPSWTPLRGSMVPMRLQSVLVAPLQSSPRAMGALVLYHHDHGVYTADHRRLMSQIAAQAAPVVANAVVFERAQEQSLTDVLTSLPNRRYMDRHFAQEIARVHRHRGSLSVLLLDMDRFKEINDEFGHQAGDRALREVAQVLRGSLREYDVCARYAGDEFVVIVGDCDLSQAERRRREIQDAVAAIGFEPLPGRRVPLGISAGAATYPQDGLAADDLLAVADRRMYQDKAVRKTGRGKAVETPLW